MLYEKDIRHNEFANEPRLDYNEFRTDLGSNNFIFVGSGIDLFANDIPNSWIVKTLDYCNAACNTLFFSNRYLFQSKIQRGYWNLLNIQCLNIQLFVLQLKQIDFIKM